MGRSRKAAVDEMCRKGYRQNRREDVHSNNGVRSRGGRGGGRPPPDFGGKFVNRVRPQILAGFVMKFLTL